MILDKQTTLSDAQAITATAASTNVYDTGSTADVGPGRDIEVDVMIGTAFNTLTSLDVALQTATDAAFTSPITLQSVNILLAALTAGKKVSLSCVPVGAKRYLRTYYTVNGSNPSQGTIYAYLKDDENRQANTTIAGGKAYS